MKRYDSYKPSGISWIAEIPSHWNIVTWRSLLKEHTETNNPIITEELLALSFSLGVTRYSDKKYNMDRVKEDFSQYKIVHENDFVISPNDIIKGSAYRSRYYGCISPMYLIYQSLSNDMTELDFLGFYIRTQQVGREFFSLAKGLIGSILENGKYVTRRLSVSRNDINNFRIILPPKTEQKKIVEFLSRKSQLIESLLSCKKQIISLQRDLLENLIFFGEDEGKATINGWGNDFPSGWKIVKGKRIFEEIDLKGFSDERFIAVTQDKALIYKDEGDVNFVTASDPRTQKLVCPNQFVISLRSFQGGLELSSIRGLISPAYSVFKLKDEYDNIHLRSFFRFLFKTRPYVSLLNSLSDSLRDGKSIKFSEVADFEYPLPPTDFLASFYKEVQKYDILIQEYRDLEKLLSEYKQRLIADVVTGQVDVRNL